METHQLLLLMVNVFQLVIKDKDITKVNVISVQVIKYSLMKTMYQMNVKNVNITMV